MLFEISKSETTASRFQDFSLLDSQNLTLWFMRITLLKTNKLYQDKKNPSKNFKTPTFFNINLK